MEKKVKDSKHYQVNVTILEGRHLEISNVNTSVIVGIGNRTKKIVAKTQKTQNPYFNEMISFSFYEPQDIFLQRHLRLTVQQNSCSKVVGVCEMELLTIWEQPDHQFYHKWALLVHPKDPISGLKGYLKCDISIIEEGVQLRIAGGPIGDEIEGNLLTPFDVPYRRRNAVYSINIYRADGIKCRQERCGKLVNVKCKYLYAKVHFAAKTAKTKVAKGEEHPVWNQVLNFIEPIPSLFQTVRIELWDKRKGCLVGSASLSLNQLCSQTDIDAVPTFGPAFVFVYQEQKNAMNAALSGRILISLRCKILDRGNPAKLQTRFPIAPFDENLFPPQENYALFMAVFQCIFFQKHTCDNAVITLILGDEEPMDGIKIKNSEPGLLQERKDVGTINPYYSWHSSSLIPYLKVSREWPGTESREKRRNLIKNLVHDISEDIKRVTKSEFHSYPEDKQIKNLLISMIAACDQISESFYSSFENRLDSNRRVELRELLRRIRMESEILLSQKNLIVDQIVETIQNLLQDLLNHSENPQKTFPSFEIALKKFTRKGKRIGVFLKLEDYLYSIKPKERGKHCGRAGSVFIKNAVGCDIAMLDAFLWFGKENHLEYCYEMLAGEKRKNDETGDAEISFTAKHLFELRVHIYQGRLQPGFDESGLADPFVRVIVLGESQETQVRAQTLDPLWDETLIFQSLTIHGDTIAIKRHSIGVLLEVLDYDGRDCVELVGRGSARPKVTMLNDAYHPPRLTNHTVMRYREASAEILMAMELIEITEPSPSHKPSKIYTIPDNIRPHLRLYNLEVIFWGVRNYQNPSWFCASKILAMIECNGIRLESPLTKPAESFNFDFYKHHLKIMIPDEREYFPPLSVALYEFNSLNKVSYKGGTVLPYVGKFITKVNAGDVTESQPNFQIRVDMPEVEHKIMADLDEKPDWWTKYYASKVLQLKTKFFKIYDQELENQREFEYFQDYLHLFQLKRGKTTDSKHSQENIGVLKCNIKFTDDKYYSGNIEENPFTTNQLNITVRVYIVAAFNLTATDINGRCDPYIALKFGKAEISDRKNYIYKEIDPIFGKCFELQGVLPRDHTLRIRVMDHDLCLTDDLIGETFIDIENRFYTKYRASCGIPDTYDTTGHCKWRDLLQPTEILNNICEINGIPKPQFREQSLTIGKYSIPRKLGEHREVLALRVLRNLEKIPEFGFNVVPEHIEIRPLYHPRKPRIDQGRLEMWVDIFAGHGSLPAAVDVTPRQPQKLELRVIVWNTAEVLASDVNLITRETSSDIYVVAWLTSNKESQRTDIHYRSLTGEGLFNWRFIFPFLFSPSEHQMLVYRKKAFSEYLEKMKIPPRLEVQVWDNDLLIDDFIGSLTLDLTNLPKGAQSAKKCDLSMMESLYPRVSLFKLKKLRGWWPLRSRVKGGSLAGKIDMELEILSEEESKLSPAGLGREGPQSLPEPKRPGTSFFWGINPISIMKTLVLGNFGRKLLIFAGIASIVVFLLSGWLAVPGIFLKKWIDE